MTGVLTGNPGSSDQKLGHKLEEGLYLNFLELFYFLVTFSFSLWLEIFSLAPVFICIFLLLSAVFSFRAFFCALQLQLPVSYTHLTLPTIYSV